jgi:AbrB family looped-hinge helix DNA binding protein
MSKITSKLQVTVPKAIADRYGIRPGDELDWIAADETIRVVPSGPGRRARHGRSVEERLKLFDRATERQTQREAQRSPRRRRVDDAWKPHEIERGWRREDLYTRGRPR